MRRKSLRKRSGHGSAPEARPEPARSGGEAAALTRLDKWTSYDHAQAGVRPAFRAVIRDYGRGDVEATVTIARTPRTKKGSHRTTLKEEISQETRAENIRRAVARAKTTIRRTIMAAKLDHLLTLTYRENMQDYVRAWADYQKLIRTLKRSSGKRSIPFVAVIELQKRGAIHIHAALNGFQNIPLLRSLWHRVLGGSDRGNIDVQYFGSAGAQLARYLAKYVSKELGSGAQGIHRYKRSRGLAVPQEIILWPYHSALDAELISAFEARGGRLKFCKNRLSQEGPKWLWACSW